MSAVVEMPKNAIVQNAGRMSVAEVTQNVIAVQEIMRAVMKPEVHYGVIPGTDKPALYKPGAELLCMTFRIADDYQVDDLSRDGVIRYRVMCIGRHQATGMVLGQGIGECSTDEEKYRWRKAVCQEEWDETPPTLRRKKYARGKNRTHYVIDQIRTEPADLANTALKMAAKRAKIAMVLNVTAASDMFTQDIEDLDEALRDSLAEKPQHDPNLAEHWVTEAGKAATSAELAGTWKAGLVAIKAARDMASYNLFKEAVEKRGTELKAKEQQAAAEREPGVDDDDPFIRDMDAAGSAA
ncbi:MAG: hypothetical protein KF822_09605 [Steroidobacteraceae bacterium]|nr:hypothetical protein [Steroidobacteraceae bacterium]